MMGIAVLAPERAGDCQLPIATQPAVLGSCKAVPLAVYASTTHKGKAFKAPCLKKMTNQEKFLRTKEPLAMETLF